MKQVIILRKDLNMRKGKMVAQGAHASVNVALKMTGDYDLEVWIQNGMKKICVSCQSQQELKDLYNEALAAKIPCSIVLDSGLTEFKEPTLTAVAIGPAKDEVIDKITGALKLL